MKVFLLCLLFISISCNTKLLDTIISRLSHRFPLPKTQTQIFVTNIHNAKIPITINTNLNKNALSSLLNVDVSEKAIKFFESHINDTLSVNSDSSFNYQQGRTKMSLTKSAYGIEVIDDQVHIVYFEVEIEGTIYKNDKKMLVPCDGPRRPGQLIQRHCRQSVVSKGEGEYAANELHLIRRQLEVKCNEELINRINDLKSVMVKSFLTTLE